MAKTEVDVKQQRQQEAEDALGALVAGVLALDMALAALDEAQRRYRLAGGTLPAGALAPAPGLRSAVAAALRTWRQTAPGLLGVKPEDARARALQEAQRDLEERKTWLDQAIALPAEVGADRKRLITDRLLGLRQAQQRLASLQGKALRLPAFDGELATLLRNNPARVTREFLTPEEIERLSPGGKKPKILGEV